MDAVREPFNVNSLAQVAATAALQDRAFVQRTRAMVCAGRRVLVRELERLGYEVIPSVTNFLLIKIGPAASTIAQRLLAQGVIVREMRAWKLVGCLRVTIGTTSENRRFLQALHHALQRR